MYMVTTAVNRNTANESKIIKIESKSYISKSCHVLVMYTKITQPKVVKVKEIIVTLGLVYFQIFSFEYLEIQKKLRLWQRYLILGKIVNFPYFRKLYSCVVFHFLTILSHLQTVPSSQTQIKIFPFLDSEVWRIAEVHLGWERTE